MAYIFSAFIFSVSANLDNVVIGIAFGVNQIKLSWASNLLIAMITSVGTYLSMTIGKYAAAYLSANTANLLGSGMIIAMGLYFFVRSLFVMLKNRKVREVAVKNMEDMLDYATESDQNANGSISLREAMFLGFGLTMNNLGTGIAASAAGVDIKLTVLFTFVLSFLFVMVGHTLGKKVLGRVLGHLAPMLSGLLLVLLGLFQFLY